MEKGKPRELKFSPVSLYARLSDYSLYLSKTLLETLPPINVYPKILKSLFQRVFLSDKQ
jgi:hypothetical protein